MKEEFPSFNKYQKTKIADAAFKEATSGCTDTEMLDAIMHIVSKYERRQDSRKKQKDIKDKLKDNLESEGYPLVFFVCSTHDKCAPDHQDYEGRLYYDRFWKMKYKNQPEWLVNKIDNFITKHRLISLQKIIKGPVWLTTRPYCKHFFTGVDTLNALTMNIEPPLTHGRSTKPGSSKKDIKKRLGIS